MLSGVQRAVSLCRSVWSQRRGRLSLPRFLTYVVTFTCNARCIMCDSWRKTSDSDLDLAEIDRIFRQLPRMDAVRLTGGEPFVRRDLLEIAHLAQDKLHPLFLHVTTNGFLPDRIIDFCERRKTAVPLKLLVSVDGVGEKHNAIRGQDYAWTRVMQTVTALAPRREELRLDLAVNQTIVDAEGARHYTKLRELLKPLGIKNQVVMAYDTSATYSTAAETVMAPLGIGQFSTFGEFSQVELRKLFDELERDLGDLPLPDRIAKGYYLRGIRNRLLHDRGDPNPPCVALSSHLRLMPDGSVPTCQFNSKLVGSLRDRSFQEIWASSARTAQRQWVANCPGCWAECEVLPNAVYTGDLAADLMKTTWPGYRSGVRAEPALESGLSHG
jgi:MoaA/NifB/PqqE/SkfB family radical SAM enzyme